MSFDLDHGKSIKGTILQRFPEEDRKNYTFPAAVELVSLKILKHNIIDKYQAYGTPLWVSNSFSCNNVRMLV